MELGMGELLVIFVVFMLLFGANKLPGLGAGLGKALRNFKSSMRDEPKTTARAAPAAPKELPAPSESAVATAGSEARQDVPRA